MKLYDLELSGNCYKARLFLAIPGIPYELIPVNSKARDNKRPEFLALNPRGQIPMLDDDGFDHRAAIAHCPRAGAGARSADLQAISLALARATVRAERISCGNG